VSDSVAGSLRAAVRRVPALRLAFSRSARARRALARRYIHGYGIEIGALHNPLKVPRDASVTYVDLLSNEQQRETYPELAGSRLVQIDVTDDGERLARFDDGSQDFVIANHVIEHAEDPIGALENQLRVLRDGGVLLLAVPDKRYTFDRDRPLTSPEHLERDHADGGASSQAEHYREWARVGKGKSGAEADRHAARLRASGYRIHFHVWTYARFVEFLERLKTRTTQPFEIADARFAKPETIVVLRKLKQADPE
jgi:SAM-dependent methyltransferase